MNEYDDNMLYFQQCFDIFKTRITENEMSQSSSTAVGIPNVKDIKFTRFYLSIISLEKYREERKNQILNDKRSMLTKYTNPIEIEKIDLLIDQQIERSDVLFENQEKRFEIKKKEDVARKKIEERMEK